MMKKILLSLPLLATLMFGAENTSSLELLNDDAKAINSYAMSSLETLTKSQEALQEYKTRVDNYSDEVAKFSQQQIESFSNKEDALKAMETLKEISSQSVVMAKELAYLTSHQADNASDAYTETLESLLETTLRLSDDIGKMSDRILTMADKIGVMADRIVETQKIQSKNLNATTLLVNHSMNTAFSSANVKTKSEPTALNSMQNPSMQQSGQTQNITGMPR
jgi:hypothetical protein